MHRLDKLKSCSPVVSAGEHRVGLLLQVGLIVKATSPCIAETLVPKGEVLQKTIKQLYLVQHMAILRLNKRR